MMNTIQDSAGAAGITQRSILTAAQVILQTDGWTKFSMRKLAKSLGCVPGTIYLYYRDKSDLLQGVIDSSFDRLDETLRALRSRHSDSSPVALLRKALYTYVDFGLRNCDVYQFAFLPTSFPSEQNQPRGVVQTIRSMVARCIYERAFRSDLDIDCTTHALWAAAHGITSLLITQSHLLSESRGQMIEQVITIALESLQARNTAKAVGMTA
jgi:AcrR family transcriptional regulator